MDKKHLFTDTCASYNNRKGMVTLWTCVVLKRTHSGGLACTLMNGT